MHDVEASVVTLTVGDDTNTTLMLVRKPPNLISAQRATYHVVTASDHNNDTSIELDEVGDLASGKIDLDRVVDLDSRVGVTDPIIFSIYVLQAARAWSDAGCRGEIHPQHLAQTVPNG